MLHLDIVTIFPEYLAPLRLSIVGRAIDAGMVTLGLHDLRDAAGDARRTVDDTPYGGGPGMVMLPEPWGRVLDRLVRPDTTVVVPTPSGLPFTQTQAAEYAQAKRLLFACGRYEGIDVRVWADLRSRGVRVDEVSIGDYVLAGGEAAALVMTEAVVRLLPGALGNEASAGDDSFAPGRGAGVLEGPVFTKPREWRGLVVPDVLLSGDHGAIARWRHEESLRRTRELRPDLTSPGSD